MVLVPVGIKCVGIQEFADLAVNVGRQKWVFLPRNAARAHQRQLSGCEQLWQVLRGPLQGRMYFGSLLTLELPAPSARARVPAWPSCTAAQISPMCQIFWK